jgi:hypothetical protein
MPYIQVRTRVHVSYTRARMRALQDCTHKLIKYTHIHALYLRISGSPSQQIPPSWNQRQQHSHVRTSTLYFSITVSPSLQRKDHASFWNGDINTHMYHVYIHQLCTSASLGDAVPADHASFWNIDINTHMYRHMPCIYM